MNKKLLVLVIFAFIFGSAAGILAGSSFSTWRTAGRIYPQAFRVYSVDRSADLVTLETSTGLLFDFYGVEDWTTGDVCAAVMDDNGTPEIIDDRIIMARYAGR